MTDAPDAIEAVFLAVVASRGGRQAFDAGQVELAAAAARITVDLRTASPGDGYRLTATLAQLLAMLPPIKGPNLPPPPTIDKEMTEAEAASIFFEVLRDGQGGVFKYDYGTSDTDATAELSDEDRGRVKAWLAAKHTADGWAITKQLVEMAVQTVKLFGVAELDATTDSEMHEWSTRDRSREPPEIVLTPSIPVTGAEVAILSPPPPREVPRQDPAESAGAFSRRPPAPTTYRGRPYDAEEDRLRRAAAFRDPHADTYKPRPEGW